MISGIRKVIRLLVAGKLYYNSRQLIFLYYKVLITFGEKMAKKEIHCCLECGRDTMRDCKICIHCMPIQHNSVFSRNEEQIGRPAMFTDMLFGDIECADDEKPSLKYELNKKKEFKKKY